MRAKNIIMVITGYLLSISLFAQEAAAEATEIKVTYGFGELVRDSGAWGYAIALFFVIGMVYAVVRYIQLYVREKIDASKFYLKLKGYIKNEQFDEATKISESFKNTTLGFIFWSGLMVFKDAKKNKSGKELREAIQNAFDEAVLQTVHKLDAGLFWFDVLAQTCTYLGLLGTIWGLILAFKALDIGGGGAEANKALTKGIKTAIGTTAMGLIAAIPLTFIKGGLLTRAQAVINDIDEFCVKMINQLNYTVKD